MLYLKTSAMLQQLEDELKRQSMWSSTTPSAKAMADNSPFSCESMPFENWVQFIFIPKLGLMIANKQPLPSKIAIAPMAEHVWGSDKRLHTLIELFKKLDAFLSEDR